MAESTPDPMAALLQTWKQATDAYMAAFGQAADKAADTPAAEDLQTEAQKTYLGTRTAMGEMTRHAYEPLIEMAGGVPLSEFRRLMDMVYGLHLRLDRVDDALAALSAAQAPTAPLVEAPKRKKRPAKE